AAAADHVWVQPSVISRPWPTALNLEQKDVGRNVAAGALATFAAWQLVSVQRSPRRSRTEAHAVQM
ncbi:hypothetical protein ACFSBG_02550, partial [Georgenia yuyongxinii]|uniref:hypothetical protein n=1 Tax=Georgenia yuyongxinii TaxID=2589797 RepID=UPI00363C79DB